MKVKLNGIEKTGTKLGDVLTISTDLKKETQNSLEVFGDANAVKATIEISPKTMQKGVPAYAVSFDLRWFRGNSCYADYYGK
jgi:hypothetical protein